MEETLQLRLVQVPRAEVCEVEDGRDVHPVPRHPVRIAEQPALRVRVVQRLLVEERVGLLAVERRPKAVRDRVQPELRVAQEERERHVRPPPRADRRVLPARAAGPRKREHVLARLHAGDRERDRPGLALLLRDQVVREQRAPRVVHREQPPALHCAGVIPDRD